MKKTKSTARVALPASRKSAPKNAKPAGKVPADERLQVTVRLRRKPSARTPRVEGKPLTREEFRDAYGADPTDIEKVEEFANEHGLDVVQTSLAQRAVKLSGTAKAMQAAFGVQIQGVSNTEDQANVPWTHRYDKRAEGPSQYRRGRFRSRQSAAG